MKILVVNQSDTQGGAARAAYRLHKALVSADVDSRMLVQRKGSADYLVQEHSSKVVNLVQKLRPALDGTLTWPYRNRTKTLFSPAWIPFSGMAEEINRLSPDLVHLHWVTGGMLRIEDVAKINAPVVWSLHDMWAFTGGCHYDENCGAFKRNCGNCKVLQSNRNNDLSRKVFERKQKAFNKSNDITIVGLSNWLAGEAKASSLFCDYPVVNLPNPIDTTVFAPFDPLQARKLLNLPTDKKLVLFGAVAATSDPRKGFEQLSRALSVCQSEDAELVVFGAGDPSGDVPFHQKAHYLGNLHDDLSLRIAFCAADVMVVPSLQENLSNAIMESLSCGTPVVGFNIGGNSDLVDHEVNGYLAQPYDTRDLAKGIEWVLNHEDVQNLKYFARKKVIDQYDYSVVASKYIRLYRSILEKSPS